MQRKTDEATALQKRIHHLALESRSGRDKAQAYASSISPGGTHPSPGGVSMGVNRTPGSKSPLAPGGASLEDPLRTPGGMRVMQLGPVTGDDRQTPTKVLGTGVEESASHLGSGTRDGWTPNKSWGAQNRDLNAQPRHTTKSHPKRRGGSLGGSRLQSSKSNLQVSATKCLYEGMCMSNRYCHCTR